MIISRSILDALLPPGAVWSPEDGEGLDQLLDGMSGNHDAILTVLESLAHVRDPLKTPLLEDLEREFGIVPDSSVAEAVRRARLKYVKSSRNGTGSAPFIQSCLQAAGFDVKMYDNNPPVDPTGVIVSGVSAVMGNDDTYLGNASFGVQVSDLLVNGPLTYDQDPVVYSVPAEPAYWPLISFIGGDAIRNADGSIDSVAVAYIPFARKAEFIRMVARLKPMHSWVGLCVQYV